MCVYPDLRACVYVDVDVFFYAVNSLYTDFILNKEILLKMINEDLDISFIFGFSLLSNKISLLLLKAV